MDKYKSHSDSEEKVGKDCKVLNREWIQHCIQCIMAFTEHMHTFVILHNVRSAHNVGSIFRTSDGAGVSKVYLTGYTPTPIDRFGRTNPEIEKTSLGATRSVP